METNDIVEDHAPSGLAASPTLRWGSHVGHMFESSDDLSAVLVPYFKAGLENNERCLWVTGAPLRAAEARAALRGAVPDFDRREALGQIEIQDGDAFYDSSKPLPSEAIVAGLLDREAEALSAGFAGLRTNGNCAWVGHDRWPEFRDYEGLVQESVRGRRLLCMCSYQPKTLGAAEIVEVMERHDLLVATPSLSHLGNAAREPVPIDPAEPRRPSMEAWLDIDQEVLDAFPLGFYCCDADGEILRVNRKAIELWGRASRRPDHLKRFCGSFRIESLQGEPIPARESPMARAVLRGESFDGAEAMVENPDGRRWVARVKVAPVHDEAGQVVGAINFFEDITSEHELRQALERQQRTVDLALIASQMGTWRYTLADNVCLYDDNAQRLYGLTEARFLHDADGVKGKFHPEDMEAMWSKVAQALDPAGDGHYAVEYRVKQLDGSWRWLSAWGTVEFEGDGPDRRPVAISGASRDLTESKNAEALQRLMVNELGHRMKNTLATVQSITFQTLRGTTDVRAASDTLNQRIVALARVHDLLTARSWSGADIRDLVHKAMEPFPAAQLDIAGPSVSVAPRHALALSLALHELATNAVKYGALSTPEGRVDLRWACSATHVSLNWRERDGPPVAPPTRRGFGTRLLQESIARDLGGKTSLEYAPAGVTCELIAVLQPFEPS